MTSCQGGFASDTPQRAFSVAGGFVIVLRFCSALLLLAAACVLLSCQGMRSNSAPSNGVSSQLLYVIDNGTVSTYAVDPSALTFTSLGQPVNLIATGSLMQFVPAPNDHFLYVLWSDAGNQQHLSVFSTDSSGIPQIPAVQTLDAPSLYQFNIHRSARFVYMMQVGSSNAGYTSTVRLFHINSTSGRLREDPRPQGSYGPSDVWPASLYGLSADGTKLYLTTQNLRGPFYEQRALNTKSGAVGPNVVLYQPAGGWHSLDTLVIGKDVMVDQHRAPNAAGYLDVLPLTPRPRQRLFRCTASMLGTCETATNVEIDRSGNYLFLTDPASQQIHVAHIDLDAKKVEDTGNSIPMTAETPGFAFNPDGTLVYAVLASDSSVHVYSFDPSSGQLRGGDSSLQLASSDGFCPATRR